MSTKIIFPILNKSVSTYDGPTWYLSDDVALETISDEDYSVISTLGDEYTSLISTKTQCVRIENIDLENVEGNVGIASSKVAFIFNFFRNENPIVLSFAIQISKIRKAKLDNVFDLAVISDAYQKRSLGYRIKDKINRELITQFFKVLSDVYRKEKTILLTIDRYNMALYRKSLLDRIVDITISLESMINGATELRYKFSLYNAWSAADDNVSRRKNYELLLKLYDARSAIVHGSSMTQREYQKKIQPIEEKWDEIVRIAEKAIGYYVLFLYQQESKKWKTHQENIALGLEKRIV